jgi:hypothetical protein
MTTHQENKQESLSTDSEEQKVRDIAAYLGCNAGELVSEIMSLLHQAEHRGYQRGVKETVTGDTSDGYHTFNELYDYRKVYNALLFNEWSRQGLYDVHKSRKHSDGEQCFALAYSSTLSSTYHQRTRKPGRLWKLVTQQLREENNETMGNTKR